MGFKGIEQAFVIQRDVRLRSDTQYMQQEVRKVDHRVEAIWCLITCLFQLVSNRCLGNDLIKG